ncbi:hypothetical protein [Paludibaculum fermentans]|uniref:hypothetical protein n=1 Tax=Paludibaculum fermentans TaxID=1473598 RepID=UPI003EBE3BB9
MRSAHPIAILVLIASGLVQIGCGSTATKVPEWFEGGTLHSSTAADWNLASDGDRLATSADFVAKIAKKPFGSMGEFKLRAVEMKSCVSKAAASPATSNLKVAELAAACALMAQE